MPAPTVRPRRAARRLPLRQKLRLCRGRRRDVEDTVNALVAVMLMTSLLAGFTDAMT